MAGKSKVQAVCGDCGAEIWTFFPKNPRCGDCAFAVMKEELESDPVKAAKFVQAVLGRWEEKIQP